MLVAAAVAACGATGYQVMNDRGGVGARAVTDTAYWIYAKTNHRTNRRWTANFLFLKASETGRQKGFTHFVRMNPMGQANTRGTGLAMLRAVDGACVAGDNPGFYSVSRARRILGYLYPSRSVSRASMLVHYLKTPDAVPSGACDIHATYRYLAPKYLKP